MTTYGQPKRSYGLDGLTQNPHWDLGVSYTALQVIRQQKT